MKLPPEICDTCGQVGGYIYCICHEQGEGNSPKHESICASCMADRIELNTPENKKAIEYYRSKK